MSGSRIYRLAWIFYLLLAVAGIVWLGWRVGRLPLTLFVDPGSWWLHLSGGVAAGLTLLGAWELARRYLRRAAELERRIAELLGPIEPSEALALAAISGVAEELFFRGAMQGALGWPAATLIFTLLHTGPGPAFRVWTLFAAVAGLTLAALMEWSGSLLAPVVAHVLVNGVNLVRLSRRPAAPAGGSGDGSASGW